MNPRPTEKSMMLESLELIPWQKLEHALGPADDVPDLLRQLLVDDPGIRSNAVWTLYGNVFHQGSRYSATPYVVPFLIEICKSDDIANRGELLRFWGNLITGFFSIRERPTWGDGTHVYFSGQILDVSLDDPYAAPLHQIYKNSLAGEELLYDLINENDISLRAGAAWVLACLPTIKERSLPKLLERLAVETNPWVRSAIVFAAGELGEINQLSRLINDPNQHRAVVCMATCELSRLAPTEEVARKLLDFIAEPLECYEHIPGAGESSTGDAAFSLSCIPVALRRSSIPAMCEKLENASRFALLPLTNALLSAAFEPQFEPQTTLDEAQKRVLSSMVNTDDLWGIGNLYFTLDQYGLPHDRYSCAALLGMKLANCEELVF
ncbi:MAG: HEAT repeat domain-containing protein [Planctomycetaceae bacterium]